MEEQGVLELLKSVEAVIANDHLVYTSGRHGSAYVNKDAVYPHTKQISLLCEEIAYQFAGAGVDVVIAPAVGGLILSQWVAHHLSEMTGYEVLGVYAEKEKVAIPDPEGKDRKCFFETGDFVIKRGYDKLIPGKRVLVVEDVVTTGGSAKKVVGAVRKLGGEVVGLSVLCNRGGVTPENVADPPELFALVNVTMDSWPEEECPLCKQGFPVNTDVGKGREFLAKKKS